jgi:hypothetical protein
MRFLDLHTGHTFDALWSPGQTTGYKFWFPDEQSVNITYVMPICMLTSSAEPIEVSIEENEIFRFIDSTTETTSQGFVFGLPEYSYTRMTDVEQISDNLWAHKVYVSASSPSDGEFVVDINIAGHGFIKVGADFYGENESLYVNLANSEWRYPIPYRRRSLSPMYTKTIRTTSSSTVSSRSSCLTTGTSSPIVVRTSHLSIQSNGLNGVTS